MSAASLGCRRKPFVSTPFTARLTLVVFEEVCCSVPLLRFLRIASAAAAAAAAQVFVLFAH